MTLLQDTISNACTVEMCSLIILLNFKARNVVGNVQLQLMIFYRNLLEGVLRNQDDDYLRTYIPYSLWSASVTSETTSSQIRKMFDTHSQYL